MTADIRGVFRSLLNINDEAFLWNFQQLITALAKNFITDVFRLLNISLGITQAIDFQSFSFV